VARGGFTLIELLVVVSIIALLLAVMMPALSRARGLGQRVACQSNLRQLQTCWYMYANDHDGTLPPNLSVYDLSTGQPIPGLDLRLTWCAGNARTDVNTANIEKGYLFPYNRSTKIYHCPADKARVADAGVLHTRSYNMSQSVSGIRFGEVLKPHFPDARANQTQARHLFVFIDVHETRSPIRSSGFVAGRPFDGCGSICRRTGTTTAAISPSPMVTSSTGNGPCRKSSAPWARPSSPRRSGVTTTASALTSARPWTDIGYSFQPAILPVSGIFLIERPPLK
jgi:prepilin-type N-terminal cleavage/methylation domain-containing protein